MAIVNAPSYTGGPLSNKAVVILVSMVVGFILGSSVTELSVARRGINGKGEGTGRLRSAKTSHVSTTKRDLGPTHGSVSQLEDIPVRNTVHVDDLGRPITKRQLLEPFAIPNVAGFSVATFRPGQTMMPVHEHESMHELFYVLGGTGVVQIGGVDHTVRPGTFLHVAPREKHGIWVPKDSADEDLNLAFFGVTVGEMEP